ncbi:MAG: hypothetical protein MAG551_02411 [Candidatus Scalindua arabica]|uniref:Uncharacterized protein n=1 Tax=Candidatus Scalindua arabica TaxID=1127984 RepID=A0A941W5S4_9BACT|nr:hypothetical protein [Candidatus Scalindua arabica]
MKNVCMLFLISVVISIASCQSSSNSSPEKIALDFTRLFFQQLAHSRNSDFTKYPLELEAEGKFFLKHLFHLKRVSAHNRFTMKYTIFIRNQFLQLFNIPRASMPVRTIKLLKLSLKGPLLNMLLRQ